MNLRGLLRPTAIRIMIAMGAEEGDGKGGCAGGDGGRCAVGNVPFARFAIGSFMALMSILHMPQMLGPRFSPFFAFYYAVVWTFGRKTNVSNGGGNKKSKKKNQ